MFIKCISISFTPSKCGNLVLTWRVSCIGDILNKILQPHFIGTLKKVKHCRKHPGADSLQSIWHFFVREKKESDRELILYGQSDLKGFFFHLQESVVMCWSNSVKFSIRRKKKLVVLSASVRTTIDLCPLGRHHLFPKFVKTLNVAQKQGCHRPHPHTTYPSFFLLPIFYFSVFL